MAEHLEAARAGVLAFTAFRASSWLIVSALLFDSGPGVEAVHLGVAAAGGAVGTVLGAVARR